MLLLTPPSDILGIPIDTGYMKWLRVGRIIQSRELFDNERIGTILLNVFGYERRGFSEDALLEGCTHFYNRGAENRGLPPPKEELCHWEKDSAAIWADFFIYARINLDDPSIDLHWWQFMALFDSLPPESAIKTLIRIRSEDPADYSGKGMEKERARMRERKLAAAVWPGEDYEQDFIAERRGAYAE